MPNEDSLFIREFEGLSLPKPWFDGYDCVFHHGVPIEAKATKAFETVAEGAYCGVCFVLWLKRVFPVYEPVVSDGN